MKKKGKKLIAWCLLIALSVTSLPAELPLWKEHYVKSVEAATEESADGFVFEVENSGKEAVLVMYKGDRENVTVPDVYQGIPVTKVIAPGFSENDNVKTLRLGANVKTIGGNAIQKMDSLEELTIPGSVTTIEEGAIGGNNSLKRLIFENGEQELELKTSQFTASSSTGTTVAGGQLVTLTYLQLGKNIKFSTESFLVNANKLAEIAVDKNNPNYMVQYNILFDKKQTTLIRGFAEAEYLGIPATVERIASNALSACAGVTWFSVESDVPPTGNNELKTLGKTAIMYYPEKNESWSDIIATFDKPESMCIPITADMKKVKDTVSGINFDTLKAEDLSKLDEVKVLYSKMQSREQLWIETLCDLTLIDRAKEWVAGLEVNELVAALPDPAQLTIDNKDAVEEAGEKFDKLTEFGQQALNNNVQYKLRMALKKMHEIQQVNTITPNVFSLDGQVGDKYQVNLNIEPTYAINKNLSLQSENDQVAAVIKQANKEGFMVEMRKPGSTNILVCAIDSDSTDTENPTYTASTEISVVVRLKTPTSVSAKQLYDTSIEVSWPAVQSAVSYDVYRREDGGESQYIGNTSTCIKVDTGLNPDVDYTYQVVAVYSDTEYNSEMSDSASCSLKMGKVENVTGTASSESGVTLSWKKAEGAVKYKIYRNIFATGNFTYLGESSQTTYQDATAEAGNTYYYKVVAVSVKGSAGTESAAAKVSVPVKMAAGVKVQVKKAGTKSAKITWSAVQGARYSIYRATSANGKYTKLRMIVTTSYTDSKISNGKTYYYKVQAHDAAGEALSELSSSAAICIPAKTKSLKAQRKGKTTAKLTWKKVTGATGYEIYRSTSKTKGFKKIGTIKKTATVTYTDKKIKNKKVYYYKVRCYWKKGNVTVYSDYSSTMGIKKK